MSAPSQTDIYEKAREAARATIEGQLAAWGIVKESELWKHVCTTAFEPISMNLRLDKDMGGTFEVRTRHRNPAINPAPCLQEMLAAPLDEMQDMATQLAAAPYGTDAKVNIDAYSLQQPLIDSLQRLEINAALNVIHTYYQTTSQTMAM